jgi:hypothetical protein
MANAINWFEIPVSDMERAARFYSAIFGVELATMETMGMLMSFFPAENGVGGALVKSADHIPSTAGAVLYLNGGDDLAPVLERVDSAGGTVVMPKTGIGENGFIAFFTDTEGNKVGLHSRH